MAKQVILIRLANDLELGLQVYAKVHHGAPLTRIVADAPQEFIRGRLAAEPAMGECFEAHRYSPTADVSVLRVVGGESDNG